ncbi:transposase family protein [Leptolyngbya boryana CZ1]|uniref:Transposase family protein n=1 Tax=Leptolyngbya boryana CZ1 TaxID=3060204 RepID=A0AA96WVV7_LEPBY|nr:transposase family protein [Leptolyngbya boryana]WNZ46461.1 transposase family protein [Leptolyngbya boryana CZ1]
MKNLFHYIQTSPHRSRSLLGIEYEQLSSLISYLQQLEAESIAQQDARKIRVNAAGAGRPTMLRTETEILLCLYYLRHYPTFEILGLTFEVSSSQAHAVTHYWVEFLRQALPASLCEEFEDCEAAWSVITEMLVEWELIVDSTEQVRQRPGDSDLQKQHYSGKKKQTTYKQSVIGLPDGSDIVDAIVAHPGPSADVTLFRQQQSRFRTQQTFAGDKAYQGADRTRTPHKKPKGRELSEAQTEANRILQANGL